MATGANRVLLSGIGGDEAMGGVPTPTPELADRFAGAQLKALARQLRLWALEKRRPWLHLFFETIRGFVPIALVPLPKHLLPAPWLQSRFVRRNRAALSGYLSRTKLFGALPSFQDNLSALDGLRRQLECDPPLAEQCYEKRYPYLDRDLLEFIYAIPREQLIRPGQRRSLMRRSLIGIVPDELLNRRRKAYVVRSQLAAVAKEWPNLVDTITCMASASFGIVLPEAILEIMKKAHDGEEVQMVPLLRTLGLEFWLRFLAAQGLLSQLNQPDQTIPHSSKEASVSLHTETSAS